MKSSSQLFPVRLMNADSIGRIAEDSYLLKPNNSPDKSVEIAVTHLTRLDARTDAAARKRPPIILLHGCYQNRWLWYSWQAEGLAGFLIRHGFDVWLPETRGHGLSPRNQTFDRNTLADYARYDVPAVNAFVAEQSGFLPLWLGYGEGGGSVLLALADKALACSTIAGLILLGLPFPYSRWMQVPLLALMGSWLTQKSANQPRVGPEPESTALRRQLWREQRPGYRGEAMGVPLWKVLERFPAPLALCLDPAQQRGMERGLKRLQQLSQMDVIDPRCLPPRSLDASRIRKTLADDSLLEKLWPPLGHWLSEKGLMDKVAGRITSEKGPCREILSTGEVASIA